MKRGELSSLRAEVAKLRRMVVFLAASCASEYEGTYSFMSNPLHWTRLAEEAALKSLTKKATEEAGRG